MARAREGQRGGAWIPKGRVEAGNISMQVRIQVTPRWADDPVRRQNGRQWRGCRGRRGLSPHGGHRVAVERAGRVNNKYVTISDGS